MMMYKKENVFYTNFQKNMSTNNNTQNFLREQSTITIMTGQDKALDVTQDGGITR